MWSVLPVGVLAVLRTRDNKSEGQGDREVGNAKVEVQRWFLSGDCWRRSSHPAPNPVSSNSHAVDRQYNGTFPGKFYQQQGKKENLLFLNVTVCECSTSMANRTRGASPLQLGHHILGTVLSNTCGCLMTHHPQSSLKGPVMKIRLQVISHDFGVQISYFTNLLFSSP